MFHAKHLVAPALVCAALAPNAAPAAHDDLRKARQATQQFRDVEVAKQAGDAKAGECVSDPKYGGMGIHYENHDLIADGKLDIERPEVLVYQPTRNGKLRLGAIEYFRADADQNLHTDPDRPVAVRPALRRADARPQPADADPLRPARVAVPPQPGRPVRHVEPEREVLKFVRVFRGRLPIHCVSSWLPPSPPKPLTSSR